MMQDAFALQQPLPPAAPTSNIRRQKARRRVLILVENLPVPPDRRVWQEALALSEAGWQVTVICPKAKGWNVSHEVIDGISIYRHWLPEARGKIGYLWEYGVAVFSQSVLAWRVFFSGGIDVIQACNPPDLLFLVAAPFKLFGVRFIFDHHDLSPELFAAKFGEGGVLHRLMLLLERATLRIADAVICTNEAFRGVAIRRGGKAAEQTAVVLSSPRMTPAMDVAPDPALRNGRRFVAFYIGVMGSQDGVDLLLKAAAHLIHARGRTDIQFVLAGDGPERPTLESLAATFGITEHVTFMGFVSGEPLWRAFRTADVGLCPDPKNAFNDHLTMNKLLEYMAFGIPLVAFDLTVSKTLVGDAGVFVASNDPARMGDALADLLADPDQRARLAAAGRLRFDETLSWPQQVDSLLKVYDRVVPC